MPLNWTVCSPASSLRARLPSTFRVGGSLTGLTVKRKTLLAVLSLVFATEIVISAEPNWSGAGVRVTVRFVPLIPKRMFALGTSAGLDELALRTRLAAGVKASLTAKAIALLVVSSMTD